MLGGGEFHSFHGTRMMLYLLLTWVLIGQVESTTSGFHCQAELTDEWVSQVNEWQQRTVWPPLTLSLRPRVQTASAPVHCFE